MTRRLLLIIWLTALSLALYKPVQDRHFSHFVQRQNHIIAGAERSPYQHRVLVPFAVGALPPSLAYSAYLLLHAVGFAALYWLLYGWLRRFAGEIVVAGSLVTLVAVMALVLTQYAYSAWAIVEWVAVVWALGRVWSTR